MVSPALRIITRRTMIFFIYSSCHPEPGRKDDKTNISFCGPYKYSKLRFFHRNFQIRIQLFRKREGKAGIMILDSSREKTSHSKSGIIFFILYFYICQFFILLNFIYFMNRHHKTE